jgi:hypothetical protein
MLKKLPSALFLGILVIQGMTSYSHASGGTERQVCSGSIALACSVGWLSFLSAWSCPFDIVMCELPSNDGVSDDDVNDEVNDATNNENSEYLKGKNYAIKLSNLIKDSDFSGVPAELKPQANTIIQNIKNLQTLPVAQQSQSLQKIYKQIDELNSQVNVVNSVVKNTHKNKK